MNNSIFENVGKLAGAISVAVVALSVVYDGGYFSVIGGDFQRFASPSDYLSNAIGWLPYLIFSLLLLGVYAAILIAIQYVVEWRRKKPQEFFNLSLALTAGASLLFAWHNLKNATDWSLFGAYFFIMLWSVSAGVFFVSFSKSADRLQRSTRTILLIAPIATALAYMEGVEDGYRDLRAQTAPYVVDISKGDKLDRLKVRLLRSLERGILVRNPVEKTNQFIRWEEIRSISHYRTAPDKTSGSVCSLYIWSWLAWLCG